MDRLDPNVHAVVVGDGPVRDQIRGSSRCTWFPPVANARVAEYLNAADLMVLPSETEGTPTVLVEAGAARLPVIATAVGGTTALLADNRGLLVEVRNVDALVAAVRAVFADSRASEKRSEHLYAYVAKFYNCIENGRKVKRLYAQLAAGAALPPASVRARRWSPSDVLGELQ